MRYWSFSYLISGCWWCYRHTSYRHVSTNRITVDFGVSIGRLVVLNPQYLYEEANPILSYA
jgi:hypothetical protein